MLICQQMGAGAQRHKVRSFARGKVVLKLRGFGSNGSTSILDTSRYARTVTINGDAQISTTVTPVVGPSWLKFDGTGDWLSCANSADFTMGVAQWYMRFWLRLGAVGATQYIWVRRDAGSPLLVFSVGTDNKISMFVNTAGAVTTTNVKHNTALSINTTYYVECWRNSAGSVRIKLDGINNCTATNDDGTGYATFTDKLSIAAQGDASTFMTGYIGDLQFEIGGTVGASTNLANTTRRPTLPLPRY